MLLVPTEKGVSTAVSHHAPTKSLLFLRVFIKHGTFLHLTVYVPVRSWYYLYWTPSHDKSAGHWKLKANFCSKRFLLYKKTGLLQRI